MSLCFSTANGGRYTVAQVRGPRLGFARWDVDDVAGADRRLPNGQICGPFVLYIRLKKTYEVYCFFEPLKPVT